jgi:hypothetical protein
MTDAANIHPHKTVLLVLRMPTGTGDAGVVTESLLEWPEHVALEDFRKDHYGGSTVIHLVANRSLADDAAARALLAQQAAALREIADFIDSRCLSEAPQEPAS